VLAQQALGALGVTVFGRGEDGEVFGGFAPYLSCLGEIRAPRILSASRTGVFETPSWVPSSASTNV
jgi:hypothetical protein